MVPIISGICITACIVVIIYGIIILRDTRKMKTKDDKDDETVFRS